MDATFSIPTDFITEAGNSIAGKIMDQAIRRLTMYNEFVQFASSTVPGVHSIEDDWLGGISKHDFNYYWRNRIDNEPVGELWIWKGVNKTQRLYHGRKVQEYIAEHAAEVYSKY